MGDSVSKVDISYKDCLEFEVVSMDHKSKQKVNPGTHIVLYYVTTEVIEASQILYEESERQKLRNEQKKLEQKENNKQKFDNAVAIIQHGFFGMTDTVKNKIVKITVGHKKKQSIEDQPDDTTHT